MEAEGPFSMQHVLLFTCSVMSLNYCIFMQELEGGLPATDASLLPSSQAVAVVLSRSSSGSYDGGLDHAITATLAEMLEAADGLSSEPSTAYASIQSQEAEAEQAQASAGMHALSLQARPSGRRAKRPAQVMIALCACKRTFLLAAW